MLIKLHSFAPTFARQKTEKVAKSLTRQDWIYADRIVMAILFAAVVVGAILFS